MAYTTQEEVKDYLDLAEDDDVHDDLLDRLIEAATAAIDAYCGQRFEAEADTTRYFSTLATEAGGAVFGRDLIFDAPLAAITAVTNGDGVVVAPASYTFLPANYWPKYGLRLKASSGLSWTYDEDVESDLIAVEGRWANSVEVPADIKQVAIRLVVYFYRQRANANDLDRTVITDTVTVLPTQFPADVRTMLSPYVRLVS